MPTVRLALVVVVLAAVAAVAGFWGAGVLVGRAAWLIVLPAGVDLWRLRRRSRCRSEPPAELAGSLRRPVTLVVPLQGAAGYEVIAGLRAPHAAGGPLIPQRCSPERGVASVVWRFVPRRRGTHVLGPLWLRDTSPWGLWERRTEVAATTRLVVSPDLRGPADDLLGRELETGGRLAKAGPAQAGGELRGLRMFHSGDDPRHVDWKATARVGAPIVREWEPDKRRAVVLALDAGRLMRAENDGESKLDAALRTVARLAMAAEVRGDRLGLVVYAGRVLRHVPPLMGRAQAQRLLRYIGDLQAEPVQSDPAQALPYLLGQPRRSLVVFVTDVLDAAGTDRLTAAVARVAVRHLPVVALLRDPHLETALAEAVGRTDDAFRRAAAELVWRERSRAVQLLRARGAAAFDVSMAEIAMQVVQSYVDARWQRRW